MKPTIVILFASFALLAACAAPAQSSMPALSDPSQPISVKSGETFMIVLDANPSTGYHWETIAPLDANLIEVVSRDYTASEPVMPGSGGVEVWTLKAVRPGQVSLALGNYPPARESSPAQEKRFSIIIE